MSTVARVEARAPLGRTAAVALALLAAALPARAQELRWTGTVSYASGSYVFDVTTRTLSFSTGLTATLGPVELGASLPLLVQDSHLVGLVGDATVPTGGEDHGTVGRREPGQTIGSRPGRGPGPGDPTDPTRVVYRDDMRASIGDPYLSGSVALHEGLGLVRSVRAQLSAKAPLRGLDSGVGTGAWDAGMGGSVFLGLGGFFAFADVSYWWYGDLPDLPLEDGIAYGAGLSRPFLDARASVSVSVFGMSAIIDSMEAPRSVALGLGYGPRPGRTLTTGLAIGLSEASPDFSVYVGWSLAVR